jgi:hypothetical protein
MRTRLLVFLAGLAGFGMAIEAGPVRAQSKPIVVDPAELERRTDLVGKQVVVDDRVKYYQHHPGRGYDEINLKRTSVVFRLPPRLRPTGSPSTKPVIVQGRLTSEEGALVVDVTALEPMPADPVRLDQAIAALPARDAQGRKAWAAWAEKRSKDYGDTDGVLLKRASALQTEALRLEAAQTRQTVDAPSEWLSLADDARRRNIPEPEPAALVHKALRAKLAAAEKTAELDEVKSLTERYFPRAAKDAEAGRFNLVQWDQAYTKDPYATYRNPRLTDSIRRALDRRLWADIEAKRLEQEARRDPVGAMNLVAEAESEIPDRPQVAEALLKKALESARQNVGNLRRDEVRAMGRAFRDKLHDQQAELEFYRTWLKNQREKLSDTDADGPVDLAGQYEELLQDRTTAKALLDRAWKIDPGSKQIAEAFRTRGYERKGDQWVDAVPGSGATDQAAAKDDGSEPLSRGLRGRTPEEVIQQLGSKPDGKVLSATKGQLIEQWIFHLPGRRDRYVNFLRTPGDVQPRVVSDHVVDRPRSTEH